MWAIELTGKSLSFIDELAFLNPVYKGWTGFLTKEKFPNTIAFELQDVHFPKFYTVIRSLILKSFPFNSISLTKMFIMPYDLHDLKLSRTWFIIHHAIQ